LLFLLNNDLAKGARLSLPLLASLRSWLCRDKSKYFEEASLFPAGIAQDEKPFPLAWTQVEISWGCACGKRATWS